MQDRVREQSLEERCTLGTAPERKFDRLFIESLDESLATVLSEIVRKTVYEVLEIRYSIARNQIPERLNDFKLALDRILGVTPSKTIGKVICKSLYSKMGLAFVEEADWSLLDYVREAKMKLRTRPTQELLEWNSTSPRLELAEETTKSAAGDSEGRRASA